MEIIDLINPESVIANLKVTSKKQALQELSKKMGALVDQAISTRSAVAARAALRIEDDAT